MARLIDADKLQETLQKAMEEYDGYSPYDRLALSGLIVADDLIDDAPTVEEAVIPVRCKDCRYSRPLDRNDSYENSYIEECIFCIEHDKGKLPDDYCSDGIRRDANGSNQKNR